MKINRKAGFPTSSEHRFYRYTASRPILEGDGMRRREFIALFGAVVAMPVAASAQRSGIAVVGVLSPEGPKTGNVDGLIEGLRALGYIEGRNIRFEYRWAEGKFDHLSELAADLIRLKVDVIVAFVTKSLSGNIILDCIVFAA